MSHTTPTEFFGSIQTGDTSVYIDKDISYHVEPEDSCFLAFVYPSLKSADPPATPSPEGTVDSVSLPEEYSDLMAAFSDGTHELPDHGPHDIEITLESNKVPALGPLYNLSDSEQKIVEKYVKDMLDKGLIRPSKSPCGATILFARKKDGSLQLCVDYRKLNQMTVKNVYPLPLIDELLDRLNSSKIFTSLDLKDAYWLLRIAEGDEWKTAFQTRYGLYEYLIMPFGLSNAPGCFQAYVNSCFSDMIDKFLKIYMDDFLIHSVTYDEHVQHVRSVLQRVIEKKMKVNLKKCTFHTTKTAFLGYEVSDTGVNMLPDRVKTIIEWKPPTDVKAVQSFLGFCNFYRAFIPQYSEIAVALTDLTKKDRTFEWSLAAQTAFESLKQRFLDATVMRHFDPSLPIILETDASDFAIAGVLSQPENDQIRPVGFFSRKLQPAELNYDTHDKELLAIVESLKAWRHFTIETVTPVRIITDHNNLKYFTTTKSLNRRQVRWSEFLSDFHFTLEHRPGKLNIIPDTLSRREQDALNIGDKEAQKSCLLHPSLFAALAKYNDPSLPHKQLDDRIRQANKNDEYFTNVVKWYYESPLTRSKLPIGSGSQTIMY